jgi:hypothetical protein
MVHFNYPSAFIAAVFVAIRGVVAEKAHALDVFPELKGNGPVDIAYVDPDTHKVVHEEIDENGHGSVQRRNCMCILTDSHEKNFGLRTEQIPSTTTPSQSS